MSGSMNIHGKHIACSSGIAFPAREHMRQIPNSVTEVLMFISKNFCPSKLRFLLK